MGFGGKVVVLFFVAVTTSIFEVAIDQWMGYRNPNPLGKTIVHTTILVVSGGILGAILFA